MDSTPSEKQATETPPPYHGEPDRVGIKPQQRKFHDPDVTFEEYAYYAQRARAEEEDIPAPTLNWIKFLFGKKDDEGRHGVVVPPDEKLRRPSERALITDEEWTNASRAFRTAGWGACFFLINTDVLSPYSLGFAIGTLGWGPGIAIFTVFGVLAGYSGYLIWHVFIGVDSYEFPVRNYGDLAFRTWGTVARHATNFLQAVGLLLLLGQVVLQYGENISAVSKFRLCYAVCPVIFVVVGVFLGQIRTLRRYGIIANLSLWLTLLTMFITMGNVANEPPNYAIARLGSAGSAIDLSSITPDKNGVYPPIMHIAGLPKNSLVGSVNGILTGVLAYAGAQLFVEFMAEMRRPRDFLKAMWGAQAVIFTSYLVFGSFVYYYQGQYSFSPGYLGIPNYAWQTVNNMITLVTALIAAGLYGNIGIKVFYNNVLIDLFNVPTLQTKIGKILFAIIVPIWWAIAYVIAAAVPDFFGIVSVVAASSLLILTYALPPFIALGLDMRQTALKLGLVREFDPATGATSKLRFSDYGRAFFGGSWFRTGINIWHVIYVLASLAMSGLGMYAAVEGLIEAFDNNADLNAFSCRSPLNLNA